MPAALAASLFALILAAPDSAPAEEPAQFLSDGFANKTFDELTSAEHTAAKSIARKKTIDMLRVCADPGNLPLSTSKREGLENKIIDVVAKSLAARHRPRPDPPDLRQQ